MFQVETVKSKNSATTKLSGVDAEGLFLILLTFISPVLGGTSWHFSDSMDPCHLRRILLVCASCFFVFVIDTFWSFIFHMYSGFEPDRYLKHMHAFKFVMVSSLGVWRITRLCKLSRYLKKLRLVDGILYSVSNGSVLLFQTSCVVLVPLNLTNGYWRNRLLLIKECSEVAIKWMHRVIKTLYKLHNSQRMKIYFGFH